MELPFEEHNRHRSLPLVFRQRKPGGAVISPFVKVPVLSEQITVVQPRVSTAGIFLISAFRFAISCMPMAKRACNNGGERFGNSCHCERNSEHQHHQNELQIQVSAYGFPNDAHAHDQNTERSAQ